MSAPPKLTEGRKDFALGFAAVVLARFLAPGNNDDPRRSTIMGVGRDLIAMMNDRTEAEEFLRMFPVFQPPERKL